MICPVGRPRHSWEKKIHSLCLFWREAADVAQVRDDGFLTRVGQREEDDCM